EEIVDQQGITILSSFHKRSETILLTGVHVRAALHKETSDDGVSAGNRTMEWGNLLAIARNRVHPGPCIQQHRCRLSILAKKSNQVQRRKAILCIAAGQRP